MTLVLNTFVSKTDLALAYFPHLTAHSALNKLMSLICSDNCDLISKLRGTGYTDLQKYLSPLQVEMIISRYGNPFK